MGANMETINGFPVVIREDCPRDTVYFLSQGSKSKNLDTGDFIELVPGYYVNPLSVGMLTGIKLDESASDVLVGPWEMSG